LQGGHSRQNQTVPAGNQTKITIGVDGTVSKRYKEWLKIQKHELVTDSES